MELKKPQTVDEQIDRLICHKMNIGDTSFAKQTLSEINYYRFSGYALQFRDNENPDDYVQGTKFEDVWQLLRFDAEMRYILKQYLDIVELYARTQISHIFSLLKCRKPPYDQHYKSSNFFNKEIHNNIITSSLDREKVNSKDSLFVIHHDEKYEGKMPLWVIVELLSFANLSKLYSAMYFGEQDEIAIAMGTSKETLKNHLHCLSNLRNKVAHSGRLYNVRYNPPVMLGRKFLHKNPDVIGNTLFAYMIALLRRIPNEADEIGFIGKVAGIVSGKADCVQLDLLGFPKDYLVRLSREIK